MKTAAVVLCALLLAGCDSTGGPAKAHPSSAASGGLAGGAPPAPRFDPPHRFAEASAVIDGGPLVVLDGVAYYYTYDGPAAADLATGRPRWAVRLPGTQREVMGRTGKDKPPVPGIITDAQGKALVVAAYDEESTGTGIQQDTARTIVAGIDLSGRTRWTAAVSA